MNDQLDELLHEQGHRWVTGQPVPPSLDDMLRKASSRRRPRPAFAVAAAVIAVAVVAAIPISRSITGSTAPGGASGSASPPVSAATVVQTAPSTPPVDPVLQVLVARARSAATAEGDPNATGEAVRTTYVKAEETVLDGDTSSSPPGLTEVWIIQIHGTFTCSDCKGPVGGPSPHGTAIALVINARTFVGYDFALTQKPHDLSNLGTVVQLPM